MKARSEMIDQVSEMVESILVPGKLVHKVLSVIVNLLNAERGVVLMLGDSSKVQVNTSAGANTSDLNPVKDVCIGYLGEISKSVGVTYVSDTRKDEKFRKISALRTSDILSFACVPLKLEGSLYGILYLDSTVSARLISSLDLERIVRYAKLITNALIREQKLPDIDVKVAAVCVNDYLAERTIDEIERMQLSALLAKNNWNVTRTSQAMDVPRRTLYNKMTKHGIRRPRRGKLIASATTA
jgi:transcriptional regulator with GAF, ATPase, and Fis domain